MSADQDSPTLTANINLTIGGRSVALQVEVPQEPVAPSRLLPLARSLAHLVVDDAVEALSEPVTCAKGCGACCRQLVPVPLLEARALRQVVDAMPDTRREAVVARFRAAQARMDELGILSRIRVFDSLSAEARQALALEYFHAGVPCPFLEEESCSIHPERPTICREYLVTSNPAHCSAPSANTIRTVEIRTRVSRAAIGLESARGPDFPPWVPLIDALDAADNLPPEALAPGPELLKALFNTLSRNEVDLPPLPSGFTGRQA